MGEEPVFQKQILIDSTGTVSECVLSSIKNRFQKRKPGNNQAFLMECEHGSERSAKRRDSVTIEYRVL